MAGSRWTGERDRELALRYQAGEPVEAIATAFGVPERTVRGRISTLGLLRRAVRGRDKPAGGNAAWVLGAALRTGLEAPVEPFASDLLARLDEPSPEPDARADERQG